MEELSGWRWECEDEAGREEGGRRGGGLDFCSGSLGGYMSVCSGVCYIKCEGGSNNELLVNPHLFCF